MTTIYVKVIRNERTGYDEVFRTTKPGYVPKGYTLVKNLQSFTIGMEEPTKKKSWFARLMGLRWKVYGKRNEPAFVCSGLISPCCCVIIGTRCGYP